MRAYTRRPKTFLIYRRRWRSNFRSEDPMSIIHYNIILVLRSFGVSNKKTNKKQVAYNPLNTFGSFHFVVRCGEFSRFSKVLRQIRIQLTFQ